MTVLGHLAPIMVGHHLAVILHAYFGAREVLDVVAKGHHQLVAHQPLAHQFQRHTVGHLLDYHSRLLRGVGFRQHLTARQRIGFGSVGLDVVNRAGFPSPGMVNQQLGIDAEETVEKVLVPD